ncbi:alpha/beta fold hydrolase [Halomonas sp. C05BenzN]|uniref:alpha/beta fold hydrolase n=1 Tax=Halomonas sp. C05BenzN TaxID=3411041 RepID=UPI003B964852
MPYIDNAQVRIHYRQAGEGPPLVLQHGFSDSIAGWYEAGWVARLERHFRLIMIDARGHGDSDKPHAPEAYALAHRVADVVAVLDALGLERVHCLGYSMGGWIGLGLAQAAPHRLLSLSLGGIHPYGQDMGPYRQGIAGGMAAWADVLRQAAGPRLTEAGVQRFLRNDPLALAAAVAHDRPPLEGPWGQLRCPCLLFAGSNDPLLPQIERFHDELNDARLVRLPQANHIQAILDPDGLAPTLIDLVMQNRSPVDSVT